MFNMHNYNIKYNVAFFMTIECRNFQYHFEREMFETLARFLARWRDKLKNWHAKLKRWHAVWHVGTFIGTLARKNENLARFRQVGTQTRWYISCTSTQ